MTSSRAPSASASSIARVFSTMARDRESGSVAVMKPPRHTVETLSPTAEMILAASADPTSWMRLRQGPIHPRPASAHADAHSAKDAYLAVAVLSDSIDRSPTHASTVISGTLIRRPCSAESRPSWAS